MLQLCHLSCRKTPVLGKMDQKRLCRTTQNSFCKQITLVFNTSLRETAGPKTRVPTSLVPTFKALLFTSRASRVRTVFGAQPCDERRASPTLEAVCGEETQRHSITNHSDREISGAFIPRYYECSKPQSNTAVVGNRKLSSQSALKPQGTEASLQN